MIALDLFCGAGGASKGLADAGFQKVCGVDIIPQKEYIFPNNLITEDALKFHIRTLRMYDYIWASPPCHAYSVGTKGFRNNGKQYQDLIAKTRKSLLKTDKPFVIENVPLAPLRKDLMLCGEMFGLKIIRHRLFEIHGFKCKQPKHKEHKKPICIDGKKRSYYEGVWGKGRYSGYLKNWQKAMEISWVKKEKTLAQCVPPAYAEYIGKQFLEASKWPNTLLKTVKPAGKK